MYFRRGGEEKDPTLLGTITVKDRKGSLHAFVGQSFRRNHLAPNKCRFVIWWVLSPSSPHYGCPKPHLLIFVAVQPIPRTKEQVSSVFWEGIDGKVFEKLVRGPENPLWHGWPCHVLPACQAACLRACLPLTSFRFQFHLGEYCRKLKTRRNCSIFAMPRERTRELLLNQLF